MSGAAKIAARKLFADDCPVKYTGPIEGADGARPYNGYLWNTEWWWANRHDPRMSRRFHFGYVALADGRFAVSGFLHAIESDNRRCSWETKPEQLRRHNCFDTRRAAIRTAAADLLRLARGARLWRQANHHDSLHDPVKFAALVNWVRAVVARETAGPEPRVMVAVPLPPPPPRPTGLPILDWCSGAA